MDELARPAGRAEDAALTGGLAAPARRALAEAGYARLEQFTAVTEAEVRQLHGMGPKAMEQIRLALAAKGLSFLK
jgi:hypothetical protein